MIVTFQMIKEERIQKRIAKIALEEAKDDEDDDNEEEDK